MPIQLRNRLTYANVVSTLCLFIVLGGTSYAVATNSIGSAQIKNNSIRSKDIRNNQVSSGDVKNSSLLARDFRAGQLSTGARGAIGPQGPAGVVGAVTVQRTDFSVPESGTGTVSVLVDCPAGTKIIAGGSSLDQNGSDDINLTASRPSRTSLGVEGPGDGETFDAWRVVYQNPAGGTGTATARAFAICVQT